MSMLRHVVPQLAVPVYHDQHRRVRVPRERVADASGVLVRG